MSVPHLGSPVASSPAVPQLYSQFRSQAAPPGAPRAPRGGVAGLRTPPLRLPEHRGAGCRCFSWGQRGPLRGSQTAALNRRGSFAPSTVTPRMNAAPRTALYWVSASPDLDQGGSGPVFSHLAQLELFSWASTQASPCTSQERSCASLLLFL